MYFLKPAADSQQVIMLVVLSPLVEYFPKAFVALGDSSNE